jgi:vancomycin resistance protein YoaR
MESSIKNSKSNYIVGIGVILVILASLLSGYVTYHYSEIRYWDKLIYPGVTVEGINLSGETKEQAALIIKQTYSEKISNNKINITTADKKYTLNYSKIDPKYNLNEVIDEAYIYGKNLNLFHKYIIIKSPKAINYKLKFSYDTKQIKSIINKIQQDVNKEPVNATLQINGEQFNIIPEQNGTKLQKEKLEKDISSQIDTGILDNAEFKTSMQVDEARIKGNILKDVNSKIGGFSTNFGSISSAERANNIAIATRSINGTVLLPGEIFSFNNVVGERTASKGYEAAPVIVNNKLESGLGGGICQVSTTLYNAVNNSGLSSIERTHHTLPVHYVAAGMDATVDFGNIDYKFRNTLSYPMYIEAYTSGGNIIFNLYSNSTGRN